MRVSDHDLGCFLGAALPMRWTLRNQLLTPVLLLLIGVTAISVNTAYVATLETRRQIEERLLDAARFLVEDSRFPLTVDVLRQLRRLSAAEYVLMTSQGAVRSSFETQPDVDLLNVAIVEDWYALRLTHAVKIQGQPYLSGAVRLSRGPNSGDILYLCYPEQLWRDARWRAIRPSLALGFTTGITALLLAVVQARRLSRRIVEVEQRTRLIASGDFSPMPVPTRDDEIRSLVSSINEMASRLAAFQKEAKQTERLRLLGQLSGGLAHQLRNGLAGAKLALQLHLRQASSSNDVSAVEVALRQLTLLEHQVKRLLDLGSSNVSKPEQIELTGLVQELCALVRPQCVHAGIELVVRFTEANCTLWADRGQLEQLIVNLVTNAIEAAGPNQTVEVLAGRDEKALWVEVWDTGPGPSPEISERLFDFFVTSKPEGVGLGLAVAKQIAERHGAELAWQRQNDRTCFRVRFPFR